jgi:hypothetical protein
MRKFLLAATAVLALAGSAHAQTAEVRGCTLVGPVTIYTRSRWTCLGRIQHG